MEVAAILHALVQLLGVLLSGVGLVDFPWYNMPRSMLEAMPLLHLLLGFLGGCASVVGFIVPWYTTMDQIRQAGSIGDRSSIPYAAGLIHSALLIFYGLSPSGTWPNLLLNIFGGALMFHYLVMFLLYSEDDDCMWLLLYPASGVHVLVCVVALYWSDVYNSILFLGWVCALSGGIVGGLPLLNVAAVCWERDLSRLPSFESCMIALVNAGLWAGFASTASEFDGFVFWPSLVGFISSGGQILLHIVFAQIGGLQVPLLAPPQA